MKVAISRTVLLLLVMKPVLKWVQLWTVKKSPSERRDRLARGGDGGVRDVEAIVVAASTVHNVPGSSRVGSGLLGDAVGDSSVALVEVLVAMKDKIDAVVNEDGLESGLAFGANRVADVPRAVAGSNNPGSLLAVDSNEILLQLGELGAARGERVGVLGTRAARLVRGVGEVGLCVKLEVHHAVIERVPQVLGTAGRSRAYAR